ncbi:SPW repeat domain-containing protein [Larkinella soli]|uniref:SPW repeat domain-containing protein n=1 Tax=Larkinella soli TaxID=1770527 RepID=UPI000FFC2C5D|nr:SPW repeat protein [Larkinella soli]
MRFIPTRIHGILDFASAFLFMASPWLFGFAWKDAGQWVPFIIGAFVVVVSLLTDYEYGIFRVIPMPVHLTLDILEGVILIASPWLFGFANKVYMPHIVFGVFAIVAGLVTQKSSTPSRAHRPPA